MKLRRKLIEVALPLDAINAASAREKSIRRGHPSTLHLWWARRPLAAARAVIFSQMVDDPSGYPEDLLSNPGIRKAAEKRLRQRKQEWNARKKKHGKNEVEMGSEPTLEDAAAEVERERLFRLIEELVKWENTTNEKLLDEARTEIRKSWRRTCADNADHPRARELFDPDKLPAFHDPFAGGGALPLEAQRLGLEAYASDLNPVAVLINKAMIEIPPKFAGRPPVNPEWQAKSPEEKALHEWKGAQGLAEDVRYYSKWMRDEAEKRLGHLYPKIEITKEMVKERPDLKPYLGRELTVIAWLWARTVKSPDPALSGIHVPLIASYWLCKKKDKLAWIEPVINRKAHSWRFRVRTGVPTNTAEIDAATKTGRGAFQCLISGTALTTKYLHEQGRSGGIRSRLLAIVAGGERSRIYIESVVIHEKAAEVTAPWQPETLLGTNTRHLTPITYGYTTHASLYTPRQLTVLDTLASLVDEARSQVLAETSQGAAEAGASPKAAAAALYADAVAIMLGIALSRRHDRWTSFSIWHTKGEKLESMIRLSAIPMTWEFAEGNPFSESTGNFLDGAELTAKAIEPLGFGNPGRAEQKDARDVGSGSYSVISTDPPYFDNIPYADLSDLFYVWLRRILRPILPELMSTLLVPKTEELIADATRQGGRAAAEAYFYQGMRQVMAGLRKRTFPGLPLTIFYAFKQSESQTQGHVSTGWDTFLSALIEEGFSIIGTWPVRTEQSGGLRNLERNSLATSVVLVCRPRPLDAIAVTRREFVAALKAELPPALRLLQKGNIAPVDLAQAAIGPGMGIFTRYARVIDADGKPMAVREALALINQTLDEALAEQEGDFDADSRWALTWFESHRFTEGDFGVAEQLSKSKNTSVEGLVRAGILHSGKGKVRLLKAEELPSDWDPDTDERLTVWEMTHYLIRRLAEGEVKAAELLKKLGANGEIARELAYRLYTVCERKKWAAEALAYNGLVQSWPELLRLTHGPVAEEETADLFG